MVVPRVEAAQHVEQLLRVGDLLPEVAELVGEGLEAGVMVLSLTVEWGVGMERQDPSYGAVVYARDVRVQALLGGSNSPTSWSPEAVDWIICV